MRLRSGRDGGVPPIPVIAPTPIRKANGKKEQQAKSSPKGKKEKQARLPLKGKKEKQARLPPKEKKEKQAKPSPKGKRGKQARSPAKGKKKVANKGTQHGGGRNARYKERVSTRGTSMESEEDVKPILQCKEEPTVKSEPEAEPRETRSGTMRGNSSFNLTPPPVPTTSGMSASRNPLASSIKVMQQPKLEPPEPEGPREVRPTQTFEYSGIKLKADIRTLNMDLVTKLFTRALLNQCGKVFYMTLEPHDDERVGTTTSLLLKVFNYPQPKRQQAMLATIRITPNADATTFFAIHIVEAQWANENSLLLCALKGTCEEVWKMRLAKRF